MFTDHFEIEAVKIEPGLLACVPDYLKIQEMCNEAVRRRPCTPVLVPDHLKTQGMCDRAVDCSLWRLYDVPDYLKTQEMCNQAVRRHPFLLQFVPDWFVLQGQLRLLDNYKGYDKLVEWYKGYKKRKAQKANIKEELLPIAWHPNRVMDWCMPEDEKRWWE